MNGRECKGSLITAVINRLVRLKVTNLLPFMISWKTVICTALAYPTHVLSILKTRVLDTTASKPLSYYSSFFFERHSIIRLQRPLQWQVAMFSPEHESKDVDVDRYLLCLSYKLIAVKLWAAKWSTKVTICWSKCWLHFYVCRPLWGKSERTGKETSRPIFWKFRKPN